MAYNNNNQFIFPENESDDPTLFTLTNDLTPASSSYQPDYLSGSIFNTQPIQDTTTATDPVKPFSPNNYIEKAQKNDTTTFDNQPKKDTLRTSQPINNITENLNKPPHSSKKVTDKQPEEPAVTIEKPTDLSADNLDPAPVNSSKTIKPASGSMLTGHTPLKASLMKNLPHLFPERYKGLLNLPTQKTITNHPKPAIPQQHLYRLDRALSKILLNISNSLKQSKTSSRQQAAQQTQQNLDSANKLTTTREQQYEQGAKHNQERQDFNDSKAIPLAPTPEFTAYLAEKYPDMPAEEIDRLLSDPATSTLDDYDSARTTSNHFQQPWTEEMNYIQKAKHNKVEENLATRNAELTLLDRLRNDYHNAADKESFFDNRSFSNSIRKNSKDLIPEGTTPEEFLSTKFSAELNAFKLDLARQSHKPAPSVSDVSKELAKFQITFNINQEETASLAATYGTSPEQVTQTITHLQRLTSPSDFKNYYLKNRNNPDYSKMSEEEKLTALHKTYQTSRLKEQLQRNTADREYATSFVRTDSQFANVEFTLNATKADIYTLCEQTTPRSPYFRVHPEEFKAAMWDRVNDDKTCYNIGIMAAKIANRYSHSNLNSNEHEIMINKLLSLSGATITGFEKFLTDTTNMLYSGNLGNADITERRLLAKVFTEAGEIIIKNEGNFLNKELLNIVFTDIQSRMTSAPLKGAELYINKLSKQFPDNVLVNRISHNIKMPLKMVKSLINIAKLKDSYDNKRALFKLGNETAIEKNFIEGNYFVIDSLTTMIKTAAMGYIPLTSLSKAYTMVTSSNTSMLTSHYEKRGLNYLKNQNDEIVQEKRLNKGIEKKIDLGKEYERSQKQKKNPATHQTSFSNINNLNSSI